ncbi:MAG: hypothetical protein AABM67_17950 [Acidobacteriota bacterium]
MERSTEGISTVKEGWLQIAEQKKAKQAREALEYARGLSETIEAKVKMVIEARARQIAEQLLAIHRKQWEATQAKSLELRFQSLADQWRKDTAHLSSVTKQVMHPSYQRIIGLGPAVLPILLQELRKESGYWFWALNAITGEDPIRPEDLGDVPRMTEAWLNWGKQRRLI